MSRERPQPLAFSHELITFYGQRKSRGGGTLEVVPGEDKHVQTARAVIHATGTKLGLDPVTLDSVALAGSELATNAARHGRGGAILIEGRRGRGGYLRVCAIDHDVDSAARLRERFDQARAALVDTPETSQEESPLSDVELDNLLASFGDVNTDFDGIGEAYGDEVNRETVHRGIATIAAAAQEVNSMITVEEITNRDGNPVAKVVGLVVKCPSAQQSTKNPTPPLSSDLTQAA